MTSPDVQRMPRDPARVRRARYFFYGLGGVFTAIAVVSDLSTPVASVVPDVVVKGSGLAAIVLLSIGRFAPDRWVLRGDVWLRGRDR